MLRVDYEVREAVSGTIENHLCDMLTAEVNRAAGKARVRPSGYLADDSVRVRKA